VSDRLTVDDLLPTGEIETVYNLRIADFSTYFVGSREWGFGAWVHGRLIWNAHGRFPPTNE
jgi:hypothetical protein